MFATGAPSAAGVLLVGDDARLPGIPLTALGAPGCHAYVQPLLAVGTFFSAPGRRAAGDAAVRLDLPSSANLLGATLGVQWACCPSLATPSGLATSGALRLRLATVLPPLDAAQVRSGPLPGAEPWPAFGDVTPNRFPVLRLTGR
jgi:hypothetical protein